MRSGEIQTPPLILFGMIYFEKDVIDFLGLPAIPKKEWDGKTSFEKGIAVINLLSREKAYAICSYNNGDKTPKVCKVFSIEPFTSIEKIFVVPSYMQKIEDVDDMDLDEDSKKNARMILSEAEELEGEGLADEYETTHEYYFENITNDEEARAFIKSYNKRNKIKGAIPKTHETILMRLSVIYNDYGKQKKTDKRSIATED